MTDTSALRPYALTLTGPNDAAYTMAEALGFSEIMEALAVSVFEIDDLTSRVEALYTTEAEAAAALKALTVPEGITARVTQTPDEDWVSLSQAGLPPVAAGRFWVHGSHDGDSVPADIPFPILIDAGLAFGTGHHGTTKGCLLIFDDLLQSGWSPKTVLDLGTGAGTLAIAAAKALPDLPTKILATDIDQDAVDVTTDNAALNGVAAHINAAQADGFDAPVFSGRQFDLIFANILAGPLMGLAPDIVAATASGGKVILSGILDELADDVAACFTKAGLRVEKQPSLDGWTSLLGHKDG
ncbi:50S ribosomal protein L11 methyltransferase [Fretibacter rubidus]|uniref:50S ribosomal protein L11 methyltransferase n=1 Tax=Fretibacter rubidus TaxID=570162 RepID=UPI00352B8D7E